MHNWTQKKTHGTVSRKRCRHYHAATPRKIHNMTIKVSIAISQTSKNLRDPQKSVNVIIPPRHINIFSRWGTGKSSIHSKIILWSLVAGKRKIQFTHRRKNPEIITTIIIIASSHALQDQDSTMQLEKASLHRMGKQCSDLFLFGGNGGGGKWIMELTLWCNYE